MRGHKQDWGFDWAFLPRFLSPDEVDLLRSRLVVRPHRCNVVNGANDSWEGEVRPEDIDLVFTKARRRRMALALDHCEWNMSLLVPRFYHSAVRTEHSNLIAHNDVHPHDPARRYAIVLFLNDVWCESWGGALRLFKKTPKGLSLPLYPVGGSAVVLEVTNSSWHDVDPVVGGAVRHAVVAWLDDPEDACDMHMATVRSPTQMHTWTPGDAVYNRHMTRR